MRDAVRVTAVVVTFEPDLERLDAVLAAVAAQVERIVIVDNSVRSADSVMQLAAGHGAELVARPDNPGLAAGFNAGIDVARATDATDVLLLDQDSVPDIGMLAALCVQRGQLAGPVGAIGPAYHEEHSGSGPVVLRFHGWHCEREHIPPSQDRGLPGAAATDMLISSGSLIRLTCLDTVGAMDEGLFIDHVDTDWAFRARRAGFRHYVVRTAGMAHRLGERCVRPRWLGGRAVLLHAPMRLYYIVRNSLQLWRRPHAPARWIAFDLERLLLLALVHLACGPARWSLLRELAAGLRDGVFGRTGPRNRATRVRRDAPAHPTRRLT
jgi:rhamnosyltransferase